jgi:hypothetical protein
MPKILPPSNFQIGTVICGGKSTVRPHGLGAGAWRAQRRSFLPLNISPSGPSPSGCPPEMASLRRSRKRWTGKKTNIQNSFTFFNKCILYVVPGINGAVEKSKEAHTKAFMIRNIALLFGGAEIAA